ncbi:hypothetical protein [Massilia sp. PWRC2]|uniref:hypothetical protein n=1 Tax=Massilia sp. PWRC2 TaxID=2804626 RepID=UPI003CF7E2BD
MNCPAPPTTAVAIADDHALPQTPFDFNSIAETTAIIPPFPYLDYPPTLPAALRRFSGFPMDEVDVILGSQRHRLEGRIAMRTFRHRDAAMSDAAVRRHYQAALQTVGAIKVNVDKPDAHYSADPCKATLRAPYYDMSYDVYLMRQGAARHWIVLMTSDTDTRLLSIEELPFVQTIGYEGASGKTICVKATGSAAVATHPLDFDAVPLHTMPLPQFPYLPFPDKVPAAHRKAAHADFDTASVIVGDRLHAVEGKVVTRTFDNRFAEMSPMAIRRNYEAAVKGLGAVQVNTITPENRALIDASGREYAMRIQLRMDGFGTSYASYLVRTPDRNIWLALMFSDDRTHILVIEE